MGTVLLVEDDPDIRHLVSDKLSAGGLDVVEAANGVEALDRARRHRPDVIVLDVRMPRLSGLDVCRELRAGAGTADVPIIMLTARSQPLDIAQAYAAGATDYVVKPFSPRDLLDRVRSAVGEVTG